MLGGGVLLGVRIGFLSEFVWWFLGLGRSLGGIDIRFGIERFKWLVVVGGLGREGIWFVDVIEFIVGMGFVEGNGFVDGIVFMEGMGFGGWKVGVLNEDGVLGGGTGVGVG